MNYYDEIAEGYNELHGQEQERKAITIVDYLRQNFMLADDIDVLDVGCGTCHATLLFPGQKTGIDPSEELLKQCDPSVKTLKGKAEDLPFEDDSFDLVISLTAVHNFDDVEKGLQEMKRVGKSDFAFSILKKSKNFGFIENEIKENFKIKKIIDGKKDWVYICKA